MKLYLTYGFLITLAGAVWTLFTHLLGWMGENLEMGQKFGWIALAIPIIGLWFGIREYRTGPGGGELSYGRGVGTGVLITLWAVLFGIGFNLLYFGVINPEFGSMMAEYQLAQMEAKGLPPEAITQMEGTMKFMSSLPMLVITGAITTSMFGVIVSLIVAAFQRSKPQDLPPPVAG